MKVIHKSYKFRLYPTKGQEDLLSKHFGHCRFVYNQFLERRIQSYTNGENFRNYYDDARELTSLKKDDNFLWLKEVNAQSLQASIKNLDTAYKKFFKKQTNFPKFKSKYDKQSFKIPQQISITGGILFIPKFKGGIKVKAHRTIEGKIISATISKTTTGKYFVAIQCELPYLPLDKTASCVGIDTGIKTLATLSDGTTYPSIKPLKSFLKKLKFEQRQLSKKKFGSKSRDKQKKKLALIHERIANIRKDYLQKITADIIKNHDIIAIEDLAVKEILQNRSLAQLMQDAGLGMFYELLQYKASWNDRELVKISRWFPSSKTCSSCGEINSSLTLSDREWACKACSVTHERDQNASKNILKEGLKILSGCGMQSDVKQKEVESLPVGEAVKPLV